MKKRNLNRKGFTLIELLAVIVILAVLILLAMPRVLDIMNEARENAFITEARVYLKAAEQTYTSNLTKGETKTCYNDDDETNKLKVNNKTGYKYSIEIVPQTDGGYKYTFKIQNKDYIIEGTEKPMEVDMNDDTDGGITPKANDGETQFEKVCGGS